MNAPAPIIHPAMHIFVLSLLLLILCSGAALSERDSGSTEYTIKDIISFPLMWDWSNQNDSISETTTSICINSTYGLSNCTLNFNGSKTTELGSYRAFDTTDLDYRYAGFYGGGFDGRYLYLAPFRNGSSSYHGRVLRYDTQAYFSDFSSWEAFDASTLGSHVAGYSGTIFDGQYMYFTPTRDSATNYHGNVLRYDTTSAFTNAGSWAVFNATGIGNGTNGYVDGVYDGRYIYLVPYYNGTDFHAQVLRYDTQAAFTNAASWDSYDARAIGEGTVGYAGGTFDGRYIFFAPGYNGTAHHNKVLRYDTQGTFNDPSSWDFFNASDLVGETTSYAGAVYDGRYVYFVPYNSDSGTHSKFLRYDSQDTFTDDDSWDVFDGESLGGSLTKGYYRGVYDNDKYIYFAPISNGTTYHGVVMRYDTDSSFTSASSWEYFDAGQTDTSGTPGHETKGFVDAVFDGRNIYFIPYFHNGYFHGKVLRFDTHANFTLPAKKVCFTESGLSEGNYSAINATCRIDGTTNSSSFSWVSVDLTAPSITIESLQDGTITVPYHRFNITMNEPSNCTLFINDTGFVNTTVSRELLWTRALLDGNYTIEYLCEDLAGNDANSPPYWLNVDTTPPKISVLSAQNQTLNRSLHTFEISLDEQSNCTLNLNGTSDSKTGHARQFQWTKNLADGNYSFINFTCDDQYGHKASSSTYWLKVNATVPDLSWDWDDINETISGRSTTICIDSTINVSNCTLHFDGSVSTDPSTGTRFCYTRRSLANGNYSPIYVTCEYGAGGEESTSNAWLRVRYVDDDEDDESDDSGGASKTIILGGKLPDSQEKDTKQEEKPSAPSGAGEDSMGDLPLISFSEEDLAAGDEVILSFFSSDNILSSGTAKITSPAGEVTELEVLEGRVSFVFDSKGAWTISFTDASGNTVTRAVKVAGTLKKDDPEESTKSQEAQKERPETEDAPDPLPYIALIIVLLAAGVYWHRRRKVW